MTRYRIRKICGVWTATTTQGQRITRGRTWERVLSRVNRRIARDRQQLDRTTRSDYALAAPGDANG
ncbi:hypothetical protein A4U94_01325 [Prescottella equi]|uniref:hypothetical protein n=1 Tax=Rhodococcus hoagii TaxID=43767 RepID=UPI0009C18E82|nr:hypothetical protein [Prescottella equi]OQQ28713.1 hypothetical protein A4U94_01325 [Prescottella equi]